MVTRADRLTAASSPSPRSRSQRPADSPPDAEVAAALACPLVRELVYENEQLRQMASAYSRVQRSALVRAQTAMALEETVGRAAVALAESQGRHRVAAARIADFAAYAAVLEEQLVVADERRAELQGYMAIAEENLNKPRRADDADSDGDDDSEGGVRRRLSTSSAEKENESPESVTGRKRGLPSPLMSAAQRKRSRVSGGGSSGGRRTLPSPSELTKDRKTLLETDLAVSPGRRRVPSRRPY